MFSELPKLLGRDFVIGFLLPVAVFIPCFLFVASSFQVDGIAIPEMPSLGEEKTILGATMYVFSLGLGGFLLLALNRSIIRFKEGYWRWNPLRLLGFMERRRYRRMIDRLEVLDNDHDIRGKLGELRDPTATNDRVELKRLAAVRFPHSETFLLPTAFGNTIRAFEVYSYVMYGLDSIPAWPRLLMVMPESSRSLVDAAKAQMNFWVNVWILSLLLFFEYLTLTIMTKSTGSLWSLVTLPLAWIASSRARSAAISWGEVVKAAFDIYTPELGKRLGLRGTVGRKEERKYWVDVSRAMVYRNASALPIRSESPSNTNNSEQGKSKEK